ncbi:MAG: 4-vinyl reductase [Thermofilaceae archaeon]
MSLFSSEKEVVGWKPYEVGRLIFAPDARPYYYNITLKPEAFREVGILAELLSVFSGEELQILQVKVSTTNPGDPVRVLIAVDLKGKEKLADRLADNLKRRKHVVNANYAPPLFNGIVVDTWSFPLTFQGERAFIMNQGMLEGMLKGGWRELGPAFAAVLYRAFFNGAKREYEVHIDNLPYSIDERFKLIEEVFRMLGYGILKFEKITGGECIARVYNSFECSIFKNEKGARGAIVRGFISGIAAGYWKAGIDDITVDETKCAAKGDECCEYRIRRMR